MRNNLKALGAAALLAATATTPVFAQAATGGLLTLDLEKIYSDSAAGKSAQAQLQARYTAAGQQAQTAFNAAQSSYVSQMQAAQKIAGPNGDASKLPPATRAALGQAQDRLEDARNQVAQLQQAVQASASYVRDQINAQVVPIAEQVRAERKAAAVMVRGSLFAADPVADITAVVLPRLDARIATVPIVPPQAAAPAPAPAAPAVQGKPATQGR